MIPTSLTLNDLERRNSSSFAFFSPNSIALLTDYVTVVEDKPIMKDQELQAVFRYVVLAKRLYASSALWGFATTDDRHRIAAVIRRGVRAGLYPADGPSAGQLVVDYDNTLFSHIMNFKQHVLHQILPPKTDHDYNLRPDHTIFPSPITWTTVTLYPDWLSKTHINSPNSIFIYLLCPQLLMLATLLILLSVLSLFVLL